MLAVVEIPALLSEILQVPARVPEKLLPLSLETARVHELVQKVIHDILLKQHKVGQALTRLLQVPDRELVRSESATVQQVVHQLQGPRHVVRITITADDDFVELVDDQITQSKIYG